MAAADVLAPQAVLDAFGKQAANFLRRAQPGIRFKETVGATPEHVNVFSLNDKLFTKLQLYISAAFTFPGTEQQFRNRYPFSTFVRKVDPHNPDSKTEGLKSEQYDSMVTTLTMINQHCAAYQTDGINRMIELSHSIANYADDVVTLVNALKEQLEIICDPSIPLGSPVSKQARSDAKEILGLMKTNGKSVEKKCGAIITATSQFQTQTEQDQKNLEELIKTLEGALPRAKLDEAVEKEMKSIRTSLLQLVRQQEDASARADYASRMKWLGFLPWGGLIILAVYSAQMDAALNELRAYTDKYNNMLANGDGEKLRLINSTDRIRGLWNSIDGVAEHIQGARDCLTNMMAGTSQMRVSAEEMIKALESLEGKVNPETPGSRGMVAIYTDEAVKEWNSVLQVAREFAKYGILVGPEDMPKTQEDRAPKLIAAHYGGQDVTTLGKLIFADSSKFTVNTTELPLHDPWPGVNKSLSLVYAFGNVDRAEKRVFVCNASLNRTLVLTSGDLAKEPPEVTVAAAAGSPVAGVKIYAVVYGLKQITDPAVYAKLYASAARNERIVITSLLFNTDTWVGNAKSAAIIYTVNGVWKSISGKENESVAWDLRP